MSYDRIFGMGRSDQAINEVLKQMRSFLYQGNKAREIANLVKQVNYEMAFVPQNLRKYIIPEEYRLPGMHKPEKQVLWEHFVVAETFYAAALALASVIEDSDYASLLGREEHPKDIEDTLDWIRYEAEDFEPVPW